MANDTRNEGASAPSTYLVSPACDVGCSDCLRSCAMARIRRAWWREELTRVLNATPRRADSVAEAQEQIESLSREIRGETPPKRKPPVLRLIQGGKA